MANTPTASAITVTAISTSLPASQVVGPSGSAGSSPAAGRGITISARPGLKAPDSANVSGSTGGDSDGHGAAAGSGPAGGDGHGEAAGPWPADGDSDGHGAAAGPWPAG